jgi:hypothetical protein
LAWLNAEGEIIEDRGPLAEDRKHLYLIRFRFSEGDDMMVELTEDEFEKQPLAA